MPDPAPMIPTPLPAPPGLLAKLVARFRSFANSTRGMLFLNELTHVRNNADVTALGVTLATWTAQAIAAWLTKDATWVGGWSGPCAGLAAGYFSGWSQILGRASESTGPDGKPERDNRLRPFDPGGHGAA